MVFLGASLGIIKFLQLNLSSKLSRVATLITGIGLGHLFSDF